jgi:hypothetical protein
MTPFELDILFYYYSHADDHPVVTENPPIWVQTRDWFIDQNLLQHGGAFDRAYSITERGQFYINEVLKIPLPVRTWAIPWPESQED